MLKTSPLAMVKNTIHHGRQFKHLVEHSNLKSISSLAHIMSISHTAIYNLFKKEELDGHMIERICQIFSVNPQEFTQKKLTGVLYTVTAPPVTPKEGDNIRKLLEENSALKTQLIECKDLIIELTSQLNKRKK